MTTNTSGSANTESPRRRPFLKGLLAGGLAGSLIAGGAAFAKQGGHSHFWKAGCRSGQAMRDPGVMRERADYMVERTLSRIDATPEQRDQVKSIVRGAIDDLLALREEHKVNRKAMVTALTQPEVDRDELERIRSAEVMLIDQGSKRIVTALADSAQVLDPEQRTELADLVSRWSGHRHDPRPGEM
jgi:Spy/CpxP family protein refolding chaperone